jgi:hypothetical protein
MAERQIDKHPAPDQIKQLFVIIMSGEIASSRFRTVITLSKELAPK